MEEKTKVQTNFMQADQSDPMRKREEFAVSLRKQKRKLIIESKRKRLPIAL